MQKFDKNEILGIFLIIFIIIVFYYPSIYSPFAIDDSCHLMLGKNMKFSDILKSFTYKQQPQKYRPLSVQTYFFTLWKLFGANSVPYHLVNLLFFSIEAILLFFILKEMCHSLLVSFLTVLIYITRTAHTGIVYFVSGGAGEFIMGMFVLLSFLSYLYFKKVEKRKFFVLSVFFYILALWSKETAVFLPFLILLYDIISKKITLKNIKKSAIKNKIFLAVMGIYMILHFFVLPTLSEIGTHKIDLIGNHILPNLRFFFFGSFDEWLWRNAATDISFFPLFFTFILCILAILSKINVNNYEKKSITFGLAWYFIFMLPFIFLENIRVPYYIHLSVAGLAIIISVISVKIYEKIKENSKTTAKLIIGLFIVLLVIFSYIRVNEFYLQSDIYEMQELTKNCINTFESNINNFDKDKTLVVFQDKRIQNNIGIGLVELGMCNGNILRILFNEDIRIKFYKSDYNLINIPRAGIWLMKERVASDYTYEVNMINNTFFYFQSVENGKINIDGHKDDWKIFTKKPDLKGDGITNDTDIKNIDVFRSDDNLYIAFETVEKPSKSKNVDYFMKFDTDLDGREDYGIDVYNGKVHLDKYTGPNRFNQIVIPNAGVKIEDIVEIKLPLKYLNYNKNFENIIKEHKNEMKLIQTGVDCYLIK